MSDIATITVHGGESEPIEVGPTTALVQALSEPLKAHYIANQPPSRQAVFQALNALAAVSAWVLVGTGPEVDMVDFFMQCLAGNIADNQAADAGTVGHG